MKLLKQGHFIEPSPERLLERSHKDEKVRVRKLYGQLVSNENRRGQPNSYVSAKL
jgi:hypothetical protein